MRAHPPRWLVAIGRYLLRHRLPPVRVDEALGDLAELWDDRWRAGRRGLTVAFVRDLTGLLRHPHRPSRRRSDLRTDLVHDVRYAFRLMRRGPAFASLTVVTLALGMAASTGIFTTVDRLLLKPLPFPDADNLVSVENPLFSFAGGRMDVSPRIATLGIFAAFGLYAEGGLNIDATGAPTRVRATVASPGVLQALGVVPQLGRLYSAADDQIGANFVAVISDGVWRRHLGGDPMSPGRSISLNGRPFRVTGVMPPGFGFPGATDIWIPVFADRQATGEAFAPVVIARLAPGVTPAAAEARLVELDRARGAPPDSAPPRVLPLKASLTEPVRPTLLLLGCSVALVLLVSVANVAGLLLSRLTRRQPELELRRALGATGWRLARQLATEALVLSLIAGVAGAIGAAGAMRLAAPLTPRALALGDIAPDGRMLLIALWTAIGTGILFGVIPALTAAMSAPAALRGTAGTGGRPSRWFRNSLVAVQVAVTLVLLATTSAALGTMIRLARTDLGFGNPRSHGFTITLPIVRYEAPSAAAAFFDRASEALRTVPGVARVAGTGVLPGEPRTGVGIRVDLPGEVRPPNAPPRFATLLTASPDYFAAVGIRLTRGRSFNRQDTFAAPGVAILSESAVRTLWPDGRDPIGQRVEAGFGRKVPLEVVGVVGDVRLRGPSAVARLDQMYRPMAQQPPFGSMSFVVEMERSEAGAGLAADVRRALATVDPGVPVDQVEPIRVIAARFLASHRLAAALLGAFAVMTLVLASVGLYAVLSQLVAQRTREFGIRMALGADRSRLLRGVMATGLRLSLAGIVLGGAAAGASARLIARFVPSMDPPAAAGIVANAVLLVTVAIGAVWLPARRASRVDPLIALKTD
jgi:putative ABC transport system permease protein